MTVGRVVQAGGEVTKRSSTVDNAMGVSTFRNMRYKRASDNLWYVWTTWDNTKINPGYSLYRLGGSYDDFVNYGHNP